MNELFEVLTITTTAVGHGKTAVSRHVATTQVLLINGRYAKVTFQKYGDEQWSELHGGKYTAVKDGWFVDALNDALVESLK